MFLTRIFPFLLLAAFGLAEQESSPEEKPQDKSSKKIPYIFDENARGIECDKALEKHNEEDFRLFCINQRQGFQQCSIMCSNLLHFESSLGVCKPHRCNFFDTTFQTADGVEIKPTPGKVKFFAFSTTWEGHAQYAYELLEHILGEYQQTTEAFILPIDIHNYELTHPRFEAKPFEYPLTQRIQFLQEVFPQDLSTHSFLYFVRTLLHRSGAMNFDVYTDRFVIFAMSADGMLANRMVTPTLQELRIVVNEYGGQNTTTTTAMQKQ